MPKRRVTSCLRMLSMSMSMSMRSIASDIKSMKTRRPPRLLHHLHLLLPPSPFSSSSPPSPFFLSSNNNSTVLHDDPAAIHGFNAISHYSPKRNPISEKPTSGIPNPAKTTSETPRAEGITSQKPEAEDTISGNPYSQILTSPRNSTSKKASSPNLNSETPTPPNPNSEKPTSQHAIPLTTPDNNGQSHMSTSAFTETGEPLSSSSPLLWTPLLLGLLLWTFLLLTGKGIAVSITIATHLAHIHILNLRSMQKKKKEKEKEKIKRQGQSMAINQDTNVFHGSDQIRSQYWNRVGGLTTGSHSSGSLRIPSSSLNHPLHDSCLCLKLSLGIINPLHSSSVVTEKDKVLQTKTYSNISSKTITFTPTLKLQLMMLMALVGLFHGKMIAMCVAPCCILLISMCSKLFYKMIH